MKKPIYEHKFKEGEKIVVEFPIRKSHTPCNTIGRAKYLCEVLKVLNAYAYLYLDTHISGDKLGCKLQKVSLNDQKYCETYIFTEGWGND